MTYGGHTYGGATYGGTAVTVTDEAPAVPSSGWHVVVTHPVTGRSLVPDILDSPTKLPSINSLPEIRVPVRKSETWLDPDLDADDPKMDVYLDGEKQPIDELREVDHRTDRTILVGKGGLELEQRVRAEYTLEKRHLAARDLVTSKTSYSQDVDTPTVGSLSDQTLQNPDTQAELEPLINITDTDPLEITGGNVNLLQTCWVPTSGDIGFSGLASIESGTEYEDGEAYRIPSADDSNGNKSYITWDFTPAYDIPLTDAGNDEARPAIRAKMTGSDNASAYVAIDDITRAGGNTVGDTSFQWYEFPGGGDIGRLEAGTTYTVEIGRTDSETDDMIVDISAVFDRGVRFGGFSYTLDNSLSEPGGWLDGPELYPDSFTAEAADALSAFSITGASASLTIDDTSNGQSLQVSNDRGQNWHPSDGTENNTGSVDVTFSNFGATLRLRVDLSRWASNGARDQTPRLGYDGQSIDNWTLDADLDLEPLLVDYTSDDELASILTDIAGEEFNWSVNLDSNGDYQVSWTQPGERTAGYDPDIGDITVSKDQNVFEKVVIKGSNRRVTTESWNSTSSFQQLDEAGVIVTGSETVYLASEINNQGQVVEQGQTFDRGVDYEMDYQNGQIRATDAGAINIGDAYLVDYSVEVEGSYTVSGAGPNPREFVEQVPQVSSAAGAESIAYILASEFSDPRYAADLTIPQSDVTFDPLDALTLENLDLPSEATPLEPREQPEITPEGIQVRLGTRGRLQQALSSLTERLQQVSRRS